MDKLKV